MYSEMADREDVDLRHRPTRTQTSTDDADAAETPEVKKHSLMSFLLAPLTPTPEPAGDYIDLADPRNEIEAAMESLEQAAQPEVEGSSRALDAR